jgi:SAM-dependent methyltransferase
VKINRPKEFYDAQYREDQYAAYTSPEQHPFLTVLNDLLFRYGEGKSAWLEVGCGRGVLQHAVDNYTGVDLSESVADYLEKPFFCSPAETLPFEDCSFDGLWSYAVVEHVDAPEIVFQEMRRVLRPGGILFLAPAWQCRSWAGRDYAWKPYADLSALDRIRKLLIPLRNSVPFRMLFVLPRRLLHLIAFFRRRKPIAFFCMKLTPDYTKYRAIDADARWNMDPFDAICWFRSRGDEVVSHPGWVKSLFVRNGTLVIKVVKS